MNDQDFADAWAALEPPSARRRRIETRVFAWLDAHDTPLAAEWLALVRIAPVPTLSLAAVSAVAIVATTPLVFFLARALT
jgi:hypothetical protein